MGDVALASGYHKSTVSRALRNDHSIPAATRQHIRDVAEKIGYRPHPLLSTVMTLTRSRQPQRFVGDTIVWVAESSERLSAWKNTKWKSPLYESALKRAEQLGRKLEMIPPDSFFRKGVSSREGLTSYARMLRARGIPGVILPELTDPVLVGFPWNEFSVVSINPPDPYNHTVESIPYPQDKFNRVVADRYHNMLDLMHSLRNLGYRRIGLLTGQWSDDWHAGMTRAAYLLMSQSAGDLIPTMFQDDYIDDPTNFLKNLSRWIEQHRIDAVIASHSQAKVWLEEIGLSVPGDIGLAHQNLASDVEDWTGIDINMPRLGELAVEVLCSAIQRNECGPDPYPIMINVRGEVVLRKTTRLQE